MDVDSPEEDTRRTIDSPGGLGDIASFTQTHPEEDLEYRVVSRLTRSQDSKIEERMSHPRSRPEVLSLVELNPRDSSTRNDGMGGGGGYVYSNSVSVWFGFVCLFHFWDIRWMCMVDGRIRWVCMHYGGRLDFDMMHGGF